MALLHLELDDQKHACGRKNGKKVPKDEFSASRLGERCSKCQQALKNMRNGKQ